MFGKKQAVATRPVITFREQSPEQRMVSGEHDGAEIPVKDVRVLCQEARGTVGHRASVMLDPEKRESVESSSSKSVYSLMISWEKHIFFRVLSFSFLWDSANGLTILRGPQFDLWL